MNWCKHRRLLVKNRVSLSHKAFQETIICFKNIQAGQDTAPLPRTTHHLWQNSESISLLSSPQAFDWVFNQQKRLHFECTTARCLLSLARVRSATGAVFQSFIIPSVLDLFQKFLCYFRFKHIQKSNENFDLLWNLNVQFSKKL